MSPDTFQCTCEAGYEGATCSGSVNPCDSLVGRDACDPEFATCVHTGPGTSRCDCDPDMHTDDAGQHCSDDFPIVLVLVLIGLFLLLLGILLFIIWFLKRKNSVIVIVETLDRDETMSEQSAAFPLCFHCRPSSLKNMPFTAVCRSSCLRQCLLLRPVCHSGADQPRVQGTACNNTNDPRQYPHYCCSSRFFMVIFSSFSLRRGAAFVFRGLVHALRSPLPLRSISQKMPLPLQMSRNDSVSQLKQQIFERIQIPLAEQRLFFAGAVAGSGGVIFAETISHVASSCVHTFLC